MSRTFRVAAACQWKCPATQTPFAWVPGPTVKEADLISSGVPPAVIEVLLGTGGFVDVTPGDAPKIGPADPVELRT